MDEEEDAEWAVVATDGQLKLSLPDFEAACVKIRASRSSGEMIAWQPYEASIGGLRDMDGSDEIELELLLTRRKTYGQFHQLPLLKERF